MRVIQTLQRACVVAALFSCAMLGAELSRNVVDFGVATSNGAPILYFSIGVVRGSMRQPAAHMTASAGPFSVELELAEYGLTGTLMLAGQAGNAAPSVSS
jgi:hypothetical protein